MEVNGEEVVLYGDVNNWTEVVARNFVAIAYHDPKRLRGLGKQAQGVNQTLLHKVHQSEW